MCGCTDYREIERGYLVNTIGICKAGGGTQIYLEVQTTALAEKVLEKKVLTVNGSSIDDTFSNLNSHLVKPLYFEQVAAVVFDSEPTEKDINFLTNNLNLNYGVYIVKSQNVSMLFSYDSPSHILGYDIITLIKNFDKENKINSKCQLFEIIKHKNTLSTVNVCNDKLVFEEVPQ